MELSKRTLRRMDILKNICDFDTQSGVATVFVHFHTAAEMLELSASNTKEPVLSKTAVNMLKKIIDAVPAEFDVDVSVNIDDYGDYDAEVLSRSYKAAVENLSYRKRSTQKRKTFIMSEFVIIGLFFLVLLFISEKLHMFSTVGTTLSGVITLFIELIFEVYFEEGLLFFTIEKFFGKYMQSGAKRFRSVSFN